MHPEATRKYHEWYHNHFGIKPFSALYASERYACREMLKDLIYEEEHGGKQRPKKKAFIPLKKRKQNDE